MWGFFIFILSTVDGWACRQTHPNKNGSSFAVGLSPLALFAMEFHGSKKELKQWLNPSRGHGITGLTLRP
jgi:hypothetical protein